MSNFQQRVAARFATAVESYDAHSALQRHAAVRLAACIATASLPPRPRILEFGCGTGHLTERLTVHLPGARLLATDIAPEMVAACRQRLAGQGNLRCAVLDACRPAGVDFYDLICANLVVQWFADLPAVLATWRRLLAPGGMLALSLLGQETFSEWRAAHARLGLRPGTLALRSAGEYRQAFPVGHFTMIADRWVDRPASGLDFLRSLRAIGADTPLPGHQPLSAAGLRRVLRTLGPSPTITHELFYACWRG